MPKPIRLAVVGARRGRSHAVISRQLEGRLRLDAICDTNAAALAEWHDASGVACYDDYEKLLNAPNIDAICLATPVTQHAAQSIAALEAGKHVLCEVTAAWTLEECTALLNTARRSDRTYMMAENCCFFREVMMVGEMVKRGMFGEIIWAEGTYLHDCRDLFFRDGEPSWRGQLRREAICNWYPTHSLGPVCHWLGINRTDRLKTTATWHSNAPAVAEYARRNYGANSPHANPAAWPMPDSMKTLLRTEKGVLIEHRLDVSSPRPRPQNRYALQGTRASFVSNPDFDHAPLIWMADRSPTSATGLASEWELLWKYADEFEHPLWREFGEVAQGTGHGGSDYFVLREFTDAINEGRPPLVDVLDAITWSSISPLSALSIEGGNIPVKVPDFAKY